MGKRAIFVLMTLVISSVANPVGVAAQSDPATVYRQFIDAINRGDLSAISALVTDDAVLVVADCQPCVGRQAIVASYVRQIRDHVHVNIVSLQQTGQTVVARTEVRSVPIAAAGVERIVLTATAVIRDNQIASDRTIPDLNDAQTATFIRAVTMRFFIRRLGDG